MSEIERNNPLIDLVSQPLIIEVDGSKTMADWRHDLFSRGVNVDLPEGRTAISARVQGRQTVEALPLLAAKAKPRRLLRLIADVGLHGRDWRHAADDLAGEAYNAWYNGRLDHLMGYAAVAPLEKFSHRVRIMALAGIKGDIVSCLPRLQAASLEWDSEFSRWHMVLRNFSFNEPFDSENADPYVLAAVSPIGSPVHLPAA